MAANANPPPIVTSLNATAIPVDHLPVDADEFWAHVMKLYEEQQESFVSAPPMERTRRGIGWVNVTHHIVNDLTPASSSTTGSCAAIAAIRAVGLSLHKEMEKRTRRHVPLQHYNLHIIVNTTYCFPEYVAAPPPYPPQVVFAEFLCPEEDRMFLEMFRFNEAVQQQYKLSISSPQESLLPELAQRVLRHIT